MRLEIGYSSGDQDATAESVVSAIAGLTDGDDNFVILERSDGVYMQVAGSASSGFQLEYRAGGEDDHYQAAQSPSEEEVQQAFSYFLGGGDEYTSFIGWEPVVGGGGAPVVSSASSGEGTSLSDVAVDELKKSVGCSSIILCVLTIAGAACALL